jgi:hypothetical protein
MQAGKAEKQPPTHSTGDTAHADSTAVCTQRCAVCCFVVVAVVARNMPWHDAS